jgi:hypothetical protein
MKMKPRNLDTLMSVCAGVFVVLAFLLTGREARDIVMIGAFVAMPTKFISVARICEILKGDPKGKGD